MAREYTDYVTGTFETPFGPMDYALTQGDHASISAGGSSNKSGPITVNRVEYYSHFHLHPVGDGSWAPGKDRSSVYMTKKGMGAEASDAAKRKAVEGVAAAWAHFIAEEPSLLLEAEASHLNREIMEVEKQLEEKAREAAELEEKRNELLAREHQLGVR